MIKVHLHKLVPQKLFNWINAQLVFSDSQEKAEKFTTKLIINSFLLATIVLITSHFFLNLSIIDSIIAFFIAFFIVFAIILFLLMNKADSRGKKVDSFLPDALELIASNIKSGLTTERAMLISALPEFGALSQELVNVSKELLSGEKIEIALLTISRKIKSNIVDRTIWLLIQGIINGGQISNLLIQMSKDLREENALKAEANANVSMYVMLIFFSAAFGAPALFGISSFIVGVLSEQTSNIGIVPEEITGYVARSPALGLVGIPTGSISEEFIVLFSIVALLITSIFASLIIGVISTGKEKGGLKFIPLILIISMILFFAVRFFVKGSFGTFI